MALALRGDAVRYRKKPVVIEAEQFTAENLHRVLVMMGGVPQEDGSIKLPINGLPLGDIHWNHDGPTSLEIVTLEGTMLATLGDFIIKGVDGEFYPCKESIFRKTYEEVQSV